MVISADHRYSAIRGCYAAAPPNQILPAMMIRQLVFVWLLAAGSQVQSVERHALRKALDSITSEELRQHVYTLADDSFEGREAGSRGGRAASVYLEKTLRQLGCKEAAHGQFYQPFGEGLRNVLGLLPGSHPELGHEFVILGAHYDHIGYGDKESSNGPIGFIHNGADDNASGIAALLEIAEAFSELSEPSQRSILFAFWDGEEKGLLGSKHWAHHPTLPVNRLVTNVNLDMIGRLGEEGIEVSGSRSAYGLRQWISRRNAVSDLTLYFPWTTDDSSDHWPFYELGIPVVMFHTGLHDDYHRPSDDAHLVNVEGMQQVTELVFRCVYELVSNPARHRFRDESRQERETHKQVSEQQSPRPPLRLGVSWTANDPNGPGVRLTQVRRGTPAQRAGLKVGDRIVKLNGRTIVKDRFRRQIQIAPLEVTLAVRRVGRENVVDIPLRLVGPSTRLGISWRADPGEPNSVTLIRVVEDSPAGRAGLKPRDRVYEINGERFSGSDQFSDLVGSVALPSTLLVERSGRLRKVSLLDALSEADTRDELATPTNPDPETKLPSESTGSPP